jgi:hypothetical protein
MWQFEDLEDQSPWVSVTEGRGAGSQRSHKFGMHDMRGWYLDVDALQLILISTRTLLMFAIAQLTTRATDCQHVAMQQFPLTLGLCCAQTLGLLVLVAAHISRQEWT